MNAKLKFLFLHTDNLTAVRRFYTEGLRMQESMFHESEEGGWLVYLCGGLELMFFKTEKPDPPKEWADQPGYAGGPDTRPSWAIEVEYSELKETAQRLIELGAPCKQSEPEWRQDSYWGLSFKDPAGNTVEVYSNTGD